MAKKAKEKDKEPAADGEAAPAGKFAFLKNKKILIMGGAGLVVVLGLVGGGLFFFGIIGGKGASKGEEAGQEVAAGEHGAKPAAAGGHGAAPAAGGHGAKPAAGGHGAAPAAGGHGAKPAASGKDGKQPTFFDLPELTVNLTTSGQRPQYLRLKLALELPEGQAQIEPVVPRVLDSFQVFLRDLRPADLEGSAAVHRLKEELTRRVNLAAQPVKVDAVLLKEILVQ